MTDEYVNTKKHRIFSAAAVRLRSYGVLQSSSSAGRCPVGQTDICFLSQLHETVIDPVPDIFADHIN